MKLSGRSLPPPVRKKTRTNGASGVWGWYGTLGGWGFFEDLGGGSQAAEDSGLDSTPVGGHVGVLPGEEEGFGFWLGHGGGGVHGSGGDVAVGASGEGVGRPVVGVCGDEGGTDCVFVEAEDFGEGGAGFGSEFLGGLSLKSGGAGTSGPAGEGGKGFRFWAGGPPDGRHAFGGEEEAHGAEGIFI